MTRGLSLVEFLLSLMAMLLGMLFFVRVISIAVQSASRAHRISQAQARAQEITEHIRQAPRGVLNCLTQARHSKEWRVCEPLCHSSLRPGASRDRCAFITLLQPQDLTGQEYALVPGLWLNPRASWLVGGSLLNVVVGWNDDAPAKPPFQHRVILQSLVVTP